MKKRYKILLGILGSILIFWAGGWTQEKFNLGADLFNQHHLEEGLKRYAPTRIEWLALTMNRYNRYSFSELKSNGFYTSYHDVGARLDVVLNYEHDLAYNKVKNAIRDVNTNIWVYAQKYGWDSWVKVRLELHKLSDPNRDYKSSIKELGKNPTEIYEWKGNEKPKLIKSD